MATAFKVIRYCVEGRRERRFEGNERGNEVRGNHKGKGAGWGGVVLVEAKRERQGGG